MSTSDRLYKDKNGNMFIPMNVEGGSWDEHFITTPKLVCIGAMIVTGVLIGMSLHESFAPIKSYFIYYSIWLVACFFITRYIVFEEKYYYRMYKQLKKSEITTPSIFWDIASIKDTQDGAVLTYSDAKIGVIIRLERDTITGKPPEFIESHYDAISDFYREAMLNKYNLIQLNVMEPAGNDPRFEELDKLVYKNDNPNIRKLMELQIGYIKNVTHHTLYESDYVMFYTNDLSRLDTIISDCIDIVYKILDGAFIGYKVLRARDIIEFEKEAYGVKYFNYTEATLEMFKNNGISTKPSFELSKIVYADGDVQSITSREINRINKLTSDISNGTVDVISLSLKDTLYPEYKQIKKKEIDFSSLSKGFGDTGAPVREPVKTHLVKKKAKSKAKEQTDIPIKTEKSEIKPKDDIDDIDFSDKFDFGFDSGSDKDEEIDF